MSRRCEVPPEGWYCTRRPGHDGPCAALPTEQPTTERVALERIRLHGSPWWRDEWGTPASIANQALNAGDSAAFPRIRLSSEEE